VRSLTIYTFHKILLLLPNEIRWVENVTFMGEITNACRVFVGRPSRRWRILLHDWKGVLFGKHIMGVDISRATNGITNTTIVSKAIIVSWVIVALTVGTRMKQE
jgi:hypothetical protein